MLITFINCFLLAFAVLYAIRAYKDYCNGQKLAQEMLKCNSFYQVLGFFSRMRRDTHEQVWRRAGFMNACSAYHQNRCIIKGNTYDPDGEGK